MEVPSNGTIRPNTGGRVLRATVTKKTIDGIIEILMADRKDGHAASYSDRIQALYDLGQNCGLTTLEPLLPLLLNLDGKPFTLQEHKPFSPMFRALMPAAAVYATARQVGKSTSLAANGVVLSNALPGCKTLYVTPLYEQIRRFSNNYVRPFITQSPVRSLWSGIGTENSVLQRSFKNLSLMLFSFALADADRIRGISSDFIDLDEVQDFDVDHLPVILETASHSKWGVITYTGTPKTLDNPIHALLSESSGAEWFIPCTHCGEWNIPSREYHILAMIGPDRDDISLERPATVCHKCRKWINPQHGHWVHRNRALRYVFPGYHIPQILLPLHYGSRKKWRELLRKQQGWGNTTEAKFWNEVLGESVDVGQKLVTETELRAACVLPWKNDYRHPHAAIRKRLKHYHSRVLTIDWGGGGAEGVSFTVLALLGYQSDGSIDVLWAKRLLLGSDHMAEALECMHWASFFNVDWISHDYTGAGEVRETTMVQAGFNIEHIMSVKLGRAANQDLMIFKPGTVLNRRQHYLLDKPRSLLYTCQAIKFKQVRFFEWDRENRESPGLLSEFLALVENKTETRLAGDVFTVTRNPLLPDDFAQAVNIGCAACWHIHKSWPNFAELAGVATVTTQQMEAMGHSDYGWDEDHGSDSFLYHP